MVDKVIDDYAYPTGGIPLDSLALIQFGAAYYKIQLAHVVSIGAVDGGDPSTDYAHFFLIDGGASDSTFGGPISIDGGAPDSTFGELILIDGGAP